MDQPFLFRIIAVILLASSLNPQSRARETPSHENLAASQAVIARQGDASVTIGNVDAYIVRNVPEDKRIGFLQSGERIITMIGNMLLEKQLAAEARTLGIDRDPLIADQLGQGNDDAVLARTRMERYTNSLEVPDFTELAQERYRLNPKAYAAQAMVDVRQIVISSQDRTASEAWDLASKVHDEALADPGRFDALIERYSNEPDKAESHGMLEGIQDSTYNPALRDAALALKQIGDISEPIKSTDGYRIVQLVQRGEIGLRSFDEVRDEVTARMREEWIAKQKQSHIDALRSMPVDYVDEELLLSLQTRYGEPPAKPGT